MKVTKKCPECGGTEIYTKKIHGGAGSGFNLLPKVGGLLGAPQMEVYICAGCGYYQLFVPPLMMKDVRDHYERYS